MEAVSPRASGGRTMPRHCSSAAGSTGLTNSLSIVSVLHAIQVPADHGKRSEVCNSPLATLAYVFVRMTDLILELVYDVVGVVVDILLEAFGSNDTSAWRIFWGVVIVVIVGVIWWELH